MFMDSCIHMLDSEHSVLKTGAFDAQTNITFSCFYAWTCAPQ